MCETWPCDDRSVPDGYEEHTEFFGGHAVAYNVKKPQAPAKPKPRYRVKAGSSKNSK